MSSQRKTTARCAPRAAPFWASRTTAVVCLLGSLAIAFMAFHGWRSAARALREDQLRRYTGVVRAVAQTSRKGGIEVSRFTVSGVRAQLSYFSFYPNFDLARKCVLPGASVEVGVDAQDGKDLWELKCDGAVVTDLSAMKRARHENGQAALLVGTAFLSISAFWVWLLASGRAR